MKDFLEEHFNALLITGLILVFVSLTLHIIHDTKDVGALQWVENLTGQFVSALLTLLVAKRITNGQDKPPTPPEAPKG